MEFEFVLFKPDKTIEYYSTDKLSVKHDLDHYPEGTYRYIKPNSSFWEWGIKVGNSWVFPTKDKKPDNLPSWIQMYLLVLP